MANRGNIDWVKIRNEYINTPTSYDRLAKKYNVSRGTLSKRAKKENWVGKRAEYLEKAQERLAEQSIKAQMNYQDKLMKVREKLLLKIEKAIDGLENQKVDIEKELISTDNDGNKTKSKLQEKTVIKGELNSKIIKNLTSALRDLLDDKANINENDSLDTGVIVLPEVTSDE